MDFNIDELLNSVGVNVQQESIHTEEVLQTVDTPTIEPVSLTQAEEELLTGIVQDNNTEEEEPEPMNNEESSESQEHQETASETTPPGETEEDTGPFLKENPKSLEIDNSHARFSGAEWFEEVKKANVTIAGIGGIGSNLVYQIVRLGPNSIVMYDGDTVEETNLAGQLFGSEDIGDNKVSAMYRYLMRYCSLNYTRISSVPFNFEAHSLGSPIMMCGFDNMKARRMYYFSWKRYILRREDKERGLFIDGRLSLDTLQVLCIRGDDKYSMMRYENEFLFSDDEVEEAVCSLKQTTYMACMIGSVMTNLFVNFIAGLSNPAVPYSLPFFTEYNSQTMLFKAEN